MKTIIRLRTKHDVNGNPRRLFVLLENGNIKNVWDECYLGDLAVPAEYRALWSGTTFDITPSQYRALLKQYDTVSRLF